MSRIRRDYREIDFISVLRRFPSAGDRPRREAVTTLSTARSSGQ